MAFLFLFGMRRRGIAAVLAVAGLTFGYMAVYTQIVFEPSQQFSGQTAQLRGTIIDQNPSRSGMAYLLRAAQINGKAVTPFYLLCYSDQDFAADYFDTLCIQAELYSSAPPGSALELGEYNKPKGIFLTAYPVEGSSVEMIPASRRPLRAKFLDLRDNMTEAIDRFVGESQSGMLEGILFGRKQGIEYHTLQDFRRAGLSHVLAVSGLHLAILSQALLFFCCLCHIPRRVSRLITILFVFGFMVMAGFTASVVRAGITVIIYLAACFFGRESDGLNSLGAAAAVLLLLNPFSVADVGFLLSFSATLGILLLSNKLTTFFTRWCGGRPFFERVCGNFAVSLSAVLFTIPVTIFAFQEISVVAPLSNLVAAAVIPLVLVFGFLTGLVGTLWPGAGELPSQLARSLAWSLSKIAEFFARFPYSHLPVGFGFLKIWVICAVLLLGTALLFRKKIRAVQISALLSVIVLLGGILSHQIFYRSVITLAVVGSGYGYSIVVTYDGRATVIDCGEGRYSGQRVYSYLSSQGIRQVDSLILTGLNSETAGGAAFLVSQCSIRSLVMPEQGPARGEIEHEAEIAGVQPQSLSSMQIAVSSYCRIDIDTRYKEPVVIVRFPQFAIGYSENSGSLYEAVKLDSVNILLTKGEINSSLKNLDKRYAIILKNTPSESEEAVQDNTLYAQKGKITELMIGMEGRTAKRGGG